MFEVVGVVNFCLSIRFGFSGLWLFVGLVSFFFVLIWTKGVYEYVVLCILNIWGLDGMFFLYLGIEGLCISTVFFFFVGGERILDVVVFGEYC